MTNFLRLLSVIYLMLVWLPLGSLLLGLQFPGMTALQDAGATEIAFIICLALSIVAVAPFVMSNENPSGGHSDYGTSGRET